MTGGEREVAGRLSNLGAVSRAAQTATTVVNAIKIISSETGQVEPSVNPTIAAAASGTSPPPMGAAI